MTDPEHYLSFLENADHLTRDHRQSYTKEARSPKELGSSRFFQGPVTPQRPFPDRLKDGQPQKEVVSHNVDDDTLDAFDLELLAETAESQPPRNSKSLARISLPPKMSRSSSNRPTAPEVPDDWDRHTTPILNPGSSSSPVAPMSSPSVRVASQRRGATQSGYVRRQSFSRANSSIEPPELFESAPPIQANPSQDPSKRLELRHAPPVVQGIQLISTHDLPDRFRALFPFPILNAVQSKCFATSFCTDGNLVLSAPTGSGKTVVMELAICRLLHTVPNGQFKIVYQAPTKSLCAERYGDWEKKFATLDLRCAELTGDTDHTQLKSVQSASIIITTPEKWDSVTRKWKDHIRLMQLVKLFLIDEVHILRESRGATLEAVVSRMKSVGSNVRFIALSATVPNSEDVAVWLGKDSTTSHLPAHRERFGEDFRPVQLQKFVYGYPAKNNDFIFDKVLESKLPDLIAKHSNKKPIMIFCPTRASCCATSKSLSILWQFTDASARLWRGPGRALAVRDPDLKQTLSAGVAYHHAGLDVADRRAVEEAFLTGHISIICATSTLAVGVNLPCYLVIIKNTVGWAGGAMQEYADLEMMQMLGRAGRPQFETSACAVILTKHEKVEYYEKMVSGQQCLESCLHLNLVDHLNAEVGLGTVYDVTTARKWLAGTFLFVRLRLNPRHYQLREGVDTIDENEMLEQICSKDINLLQQAGLVTKGERIKCTEFGDAMARYYIRFETMQIFMSLPPRAKMSETLFAIAQAAEFKDAIRFKSGEKSLYKEINKDVGIKFPIKVDIALPAHKVSLLLQAELGGVDFPSNDQLQKHKHAFMTDKGLTFQHVHRLVRCIIDCQLYLEDAVAARHGLELARSFAARVWDTSPLQLKQLDQIGNVAVRKLASAGINCIDALESTESHRIELVLGKNPPYGMKLLARAAEVPKLRISVKMTGKEGRAGKPVSVKIKAEVGFLNEKTSLFFRRKPVYVCFLAEVSDGRMIDFRRTSAKNLQKDWEIFLTSNLTSSTQYITCSVMCDEIAGTMRQATLKPDLPSSLFSTLVKQEQVKISRQRQDSNSTYDSKQGYGDGGDDFDDGGLNDGDLLEAVTATEYKDLDELPDTAPNTISQIDDKKKKSKPKPEMVPDDSWRPLQLANGRYACKHPCKDKTKCTHHCCKDGLDKPPKRPMKPISRNRAHSSDRGPAKKGTEDTSENRRRISAQRTTPFEKAQSAFQEKGRYNMSPGTQERKSLKKLHESTGTATSSASLPYNKAAVSYARTSRPGLSFLDGRDDRKEAWEESDTDWDCGIGIDDFQEVARSLNKVDADVTARDHAIGNSEARADRQSENEGFISSSDDIFDFNPSDLEEPSASYGKESWRTENATKEASYPSTPTTRILTASHRRRRHLTLDTSDDEGHNTDSVKDSLGQKATNQEGNPNPGSKNDEMFLSESSPMKMLPRFGHSPGRTDSSSPFKRILGPSSLPNKRPPSAGKAEFSQDGSANKRPKLGAEDKILQSENRGTSDTELHPLPLKDVVKLHSWEQVKEKQKEEGTRKARELAEAELECKKKEKEDLDRETWGLLGPEFEEQFKDFVEFI